MNRTFLLKILFTSLFAVSTLWGIDDYSDLDIDFAYKEYIVTEKNSTFEKWKQKNRNGVFFEYGKTLISSGVTLVKNSTGGQESSSKTTTDLFRIGTEINTFQMYFEYGLRVGDFKDGAQEIWLGGEQHAFDFGLGWNLPSVYTSKFNTFSIFPYIYAEEGIIFMKTVAATEPYIGWDNAVGLDIVINIQQTYDIHLGYQYSYVIWENYIDGVSQKSIDHKFIVGLRIKL